MLAPPLFNPNHKDLTFDFEDFIRRELGLDLSSEAKKPGKSRHHSIQPGSLTK